MTITSTPRWSLGRGKAVVPSRWQATTASAPPSTDIPVASVPGHRDRCDVVGEARADGAQGRTRRARLAAMVATRGSDVWPLGR